MWEAKVFVAAEAADAAETNWKHKVTPDRGDLIRYLCSPKVILLEMLNIYQLLEYVAKFHI